MQSVNGDDLTMSGLIDHAAMGLPCIIHDNTLQLACIIDADNARPPIMNDHGQGHVARLGSSRLTDCAFTVWQSRQRGPVVNVVVY